MHRYSSILNPSQLVTASLSIDLNKRSQTRFRSNRDPSGFHTGISSIFCMIIEVKLESLCLDYSISLKATIQMSTQLFIQVIILNNLFCLLPIDIKATI